LNSGRRNSQASYQRADVAQMVERLTCNQQVAGSIPAVGSRAKLRVCGAVPLDWQACRGSSSVGRASAFQAERRGFDSRLPLSGNRSPRRCRGAFAQVAQSAEHVLGKDEVGGSIPLLGLMNNGGREPVKIGCRARLGGERYPSGQREQTVNLPAYAFGGSNPPLSIREKPARVG
jgi:hypothetical protein